MRFMRGRHAILIVLLSAAAIPCQAQHATPVAAARPRAEQSFVPADTVATSHRGRNAKRGAIIGGALGVAAGAVASSQVGLGCALDAGSSCDKTSTRLQLAMVFGSMGLVGLGALGALLGALVP